MEVIMNVPLKFSKLYGSIFVIVAVFTASRMHAFADSTWDGSITAETAVMSSPILVEPVWLDEPAVLREEKISELRYWLDHVNLPGPLLEYVLEALYQRVPQEGTESISSNQISTPENPKIFNKTMFGGRIPADRKSNVMESSLGTGGKWVFFTGNWFAARTTKGGGVKNKQWLYIDPTADFTEFCCDQIAIYDESRDVYFWLRMGIPDNNGENVFKLSVSKDGMQTYWTYTTSPTNLDSSWTNQMWDYPHIQLGADFLYMTWNMFDQFDFWIRTVILRWPLDALAVSNGFSFDFWYTNEWFTFVPVSGAWHRMYWASNWPSIPPQNNRLRIWTWDEDSDTIFWVEKIVTAWTPTGRGDAVCGSVIGNWAARYDQRVLTGARYSIMNADRKEPGRKVLAWWWNVAQGGSFAQPYIEAAAFWEDTLAQVDGGQGRPFVWNSTNCFAYPSVTPNKRQDLGMIFHYSSRESKVPAVGYTIADDFTDAPPGWFFYNVITSNARPSDNKWGDYNTVRVFEPTQKIWVGGSHFIRSSDGCLDCGRPIYFVFGRGRDEQSYRRWRFK
jgi:hypothetical protein